MAGMQALRCIGVYCPINRAPEYPQYWAEESPNMSTMIDEVPTECILQIQSDAKDAYHAVEVHVDSRRFLGLSFYSVKHTQIRILVSSRMPRGISPSGVYYPV